MTMRVSMYLLAAMMLAACTEKPQTITARKADDKVWQSASTPFGAAGFQGGDQAAWERQIKARAQGQNEYARTAQ